uniref:Uncharacterized protein n=1 Tax=Clandestinovirus TaxID=2831644 RepID=A0A8F8PK42_9VIRU|nr:hypothetical protein KOM_12_355 [Clandestinovirus]
MQRMVSDFRARAAELPQLLTIALSQCIPHNPASDNLLRLHPLVGQTIVLQNPACETQAYRGVITTHEGKTCIMPLTDNYTLPFADLRQLYSYLFPNQRLPSCLEQYMYIHNGSVYTPINAL